jgi:hypothetical protein
MPDTLDTLRELAKPTCFPRFPSVIVCCLKVLAKYFQLLCASDVGSSYRGSTFSLFLSFVTVKVSRLGAAILNEVE